MQCELRKTQLAEFYEKCERYHRVRIARSEDGLVRAAENGSKNLFVHDDQLAGQLSFHMSTASYSKVFTGSFGGCHAFACVDYQLRFMDFLFCRKDLAVLFKLTYGGTYEARG